LCYGEIVSGLPENYLSRDVPLRLCSDASQLHVSARSSVSDAASTRTIVYCAPPFAQIKSEKRLDHYRRSGVIALVASILQDRALPPLPTISALG